VSIVVDMMLLQTVAIAITSVGVLLAAIYYVLQIRHQTKLRQTDMVMRLYATFGSAEFQKAYQEVLNLEFEDYADFRKRYPASNAEAAAARMTVYVFFEGVGVLVRRKLISMDLVDDLLSTNILVTWEKVKPIVEGWRKRSGRAENWEWFEYLYDEMKKREQRK
jgi:hypothetical protein